MPTYEYKCDNCDHLFEIYQSMKDDKLTKCPECGKETLRRLIGTGSGLIFKGSGFYLTDYKNKPSEKSASSPATANSETKETGSSESGKNDTKGKDDKPSVRTTAADTNSDTSTNKTSPKNTKGANVKSDK